MKSIMMKDCAKWTRYGAVFERYEYDVYGNLHDTVRCCFEKICDNGEFKVKLVCRVRFDMEDLYSLDESSWPPAVFLGRRF